MAHYACAPGQLQNLRLCFAPMTDDDGEQLMESAGARSKQEEPAPARTLLVVIGPEYGNQASPNKSLVRQG